MHDDTPSGLATRDRTIARWTDPANFPQYLTPNDIAFHNIVKDMM